MALVLGIDLGDVIDIGEGWICIASVQNKDTVVVVASDGSRLLISSYCEMQVVQDVWIQLAPNGTRKPMRFVIEAPKTIPISRRPDPPGMTTTETPGLTEAEIMEAIIEEREREDGDAGKAKRVRRQR